MVIYVFNFEINLQIFFYNFILFYHWSNTWIVDFYVVKKTKLKPNFVFKHQNTNVHFTKPNLFVWSYRIITL